MSAHPLALDALRRLAGPTGTAATCRRFEEVLEDPETAHEAAVCAVDACVPRPSRDALIGALVGDAPHCRVVVLAEAFDDGDGVRLLRMGVKGLIRYADAADQLPRALRAVAEGGCWAPRTMIGDVLDSLLDGNGPVAVNLRGPQLSRREEEVLNALLDNASNKEIAQRLNISERTVKFHVSNLLSKFGVARRSDLLLEALHPLSPRHRVEPGG